MKLPPFGLDKFAALARKRAKETAGDKPVDPRPARMDPRYPFALSNEFRLKTAGISANPKGSPLDE